MYILRNILLFILLFFGGFFAGLFVAMMVDAGKDQMLAGGAIVLGYGVVGALVGIILAIFILINYRKKVSLIKKLNILLTVLVLGLWIYFWMQYKIREVEKSKQLGIEIRLETQPSEGSEPSDGCPKFH